MNFFTTLSLIETDGFEVLNNNGELFDAVTTTLELTKLDPIQLQVLRNQFVEKFFTAFSDKEDRWDNTTRLSYVTAVIDHHIFHQGGIV
jgi:hypothetical protein